MTVQTPSITFVCCVESGGLELQTIRLAKSLRRWGGVFKDCRLIAITPRLGPKPSTNTLKLFEEFQVEYLYAPVKHKYDWFKYGNKPLALAIAEDMATTETICWVDSDLLFLQEPGELILQEGEDFAACSSDKEMGTSGEGDAFEALWQANCSVLGIDIEALSWLETQADLARVRFYWNSGLFVYRKSSYFAPRFLTVWMKLMDAKIASRHPAYCLGINEMSAVGLTAHLAGMSWKPLPLVYNFFTGTAGWAREEEELIRDIKILHYHDSMWPAGWDNFIGKLGKTHPEVCEWLKQEGPFYNSASIKARLFSKSLGVIRNARDRRHLATCIRV